MAKTLTLALTLTIAIALVLTKLDYGSATLAGLPAVQLDRLQTVLNAAARLIYILRKFDRVSPLLEELHLGLPTVPEWPGSSRN